MIKTLCSKENSIIKKNIQYLLIVISYFIINRFFLHISLKCSIPFEEEQLGNLPFTKK